MASCVAEAMQDRSSEAFSYAEATEGRRECNNEDTKKPLNGLTGIESAAALRLGNLPDSIWRSFVPSFRA